MRPPPCTCIRPRVLRPKYNLVITRLSSCLSSPFYTASAVPLVLGRAGIHQLTGVSRWVTLFIFFLPRHQNFPLVSQKIK